ncbi:MAG: phosphatase [Eubacteriales bacterium]|nr:phosphatase [Eubacteriales bacterium]
MYCLDIHTHSIASGHGTSATIADMAKVAAARGLKLLGISDHAPSTLCSGTTSYFRSLAMAPKQRCGIDLRYGVELNILDTKGTVDLDASTLAHLDYAIASLHLPNFKPGSRQENTEAYIQAMKHPYVKVIGHCDDTRYPADYPAILQAAMEHHVFLEINNASLSPDSYRGDTRENNKEILRLCMQYRYPVLLSSDSHGTAHVGDFTYAEALIKELDFPRELILNTRADAASLLFVC